MPKSLLKDSVREIKNTYKRFLSIVLIVLLGVGFFSGITATSPEMKNVVDKYFDSQNVMDLEVISTLGLTDNDIEELKKVEGVEQVESAYSFAAIINAKDKEIVTKIESLPQDINKLKLVQGKMPESKDECVVEEDFIKNTGYKIGDYITVNPEKLDSSVLENEDSSVVINNNIKIVGTVQSPLYISRSRGTTKLGDGSIDYYMFIPKENINMRVYTIAYVTVNGAKELETYKSKYDDLVENVKNKIDDIAEERKQARYNEIVNEANEKLDDAQKEYDEQKQKVEDEIADAQKQIESAKEELENAQKELNTSKIETSNKFKQYEEEIEKASNTLQESKEQLESKKVEAQNKIAEAEKNIEQLKQIQAQYISLKEQKQYLVSRIEEIDNLIETLDKENDKEQISNLNKTKEELNESLGIVNENIETIENSLSEQGIKTDNLEDTITKAQSEIDASKKQLEDAQNEIINAEIQIENNKRELELNKQKANNEFYQAQKQIDNGYSQIEENEEKLEDAKKEADEKLEDAQNKINDARTQINKIEKPTWYILDRDSNYGYAEYIQDTERIENLAKVFPLVFFLVAALISLTSMSRMIEEERVQIGTLKALGYNKIQISFKYIIYAFFATMLGGILGMIIGFKLIPRIVASMYAMMYAYLPAIENKIHLDIGMAGVAFALICTIGATIYTSSKELLGKPASLMLPKAPKPGKRILLEKINFIWSKMKFTSKVTARNLFRYKKRFLMTIIGVAGCTALIVAGFGIRDAISKMIPSQYGEIFKYDAIVSLKEDITKSKINEENEKILANEKIEETLTCYMKSVEVTNIKNSQTINLIVTEEIDKMPDFILLKSRNKNEKYTLNSDEVIITEKISKLLNIKVGETITIKNTDNIEKDVKIGAITENYLNHYIYMSSDLYNKLYGENMYMPDTILLKTAQDISEEDEEKLGKIIILDEDNVTGITFLSMTKDIFLEVMDKMQLVVYILIIAAGLLAFAVLYNLSNVNISERIRELATIKVLGFYDKEVFTYVTKETRILTAIGIALGLFGGYFLTMFVIKTCELDAMMFTQQIGVMSYVYGMVITTIFAEIINIAVYFNLKKINMIESLKSVE